MRENLSLHGFCSLKDEQLVSCLVLCIIAVHLKNDCGDALAKKMAQMLESFLQKSNSTDAVRLSLAVDLIGKGNRLWYDFFDDRAAVQSGWNAQRGIPTRGRARENAGWPRRNRGPTKIGQLICRRNRS